MKFDPPLFHRIVRKVPPMPSVTDYILSLRRWQRLHFYIAYTGDDPTMYEQASERWSPVQSVEKVILSVISMLAGMSL